LPCFPSQRSHNEHHQTPPHPTLFFRKKRQFYDVNFRSAKNPDRWGIGRSKNVPTALP
jgi:hypothetical protein